MILAALLALASPRLTVRAQSPARPTRPADLSPQYRTPRGWPGKAPGWSVRLIATWRFHSHADRRH